MSRIVDAWPSVSATAPGGQPLSVRRMLVLGAGSVARAFLPLLRRHFALEPGQVTVLAPEAAGAALAASHCLESHAATLTRDDFAKVLATRLGAGDCLVNLALGVGSADLLEWCRDHGVLYLDTNLEPWGDAYGPVHAARARVLSSGRGSGPTAVVAHGANPGLVSHFAKQALCELAERQTPDHCDATGWSALAHRLGLRVAMVTEWDSQLGPVRDSAGAFANTWSPGGLLAELRHPAELNWGDHEAPAPAPPEAWMGAGAARVLPGCAGDWELRSWTPGLGEFTGYPLAHHESLSLGALLAADPRSRRPTVCYTYRPCPAARRGAAELRARGWPAPVRLQLLDRQLTTGANELGVLLLMPGAGYWFGSTLSLEAARAIAPQCNATTLQVAAGVLGALAWALEHPACGVIEAEDMDHRSVLAVAAPYLGRLGGMPTGWRPAPLLGGEAGLCFARFVARAPD